MIRTWTRAQGGEVSDQRVDRVAAIAATLRPKSGDTTFCVHVLQNRSVTAYSWSNGDVFLSAGLVDTATDNEIAAAIAHELGHLINDAASHRAVSLGGVEGSLEIEERADDSGIQILAAAGLSSKALVSLLTKVSNAANLRQTREEIDARICHITSNLSK